MSVVLPTAVEALRVSWLATFQSAGTVVRTSLPFMIQTVINAIHIQSALLCGIEAGLLVFFKDDANFGAKSSDPEWNQTTMQKAILSLTYISLILSLGATVASYVLTAEFSTLPVRAAKDSLHTCSPATAVRMPDWDILRHYHLKPCAGRVWFYCRNSIDLAISTLM